MSFFCPISVLSSPHRNTPGAFVLPQFQLISIDHDCVEYLRLSDETIQCLNYAKPVLHLLPSFNNLTHLEVVLGYPSCEVLADILHKSPKLEVLHIYKGFYLSLDDEDWTSDSLPCCFKCSLKLCAISDFCGDEAEIQLLEDLGFFPSCAATLSCRRPSFSSMHQILIVVS
ncbi:hypothetical protein P8452_04882 [Trifolium repens]|nr:hypothetical protein P8452_04882 [Trifolium repens]